MTVEGSGQDSGEGQRLGSRAPERRREIIEASLRVIHRDGLDGMSIRSIAKELGTSTGVLTHHFRDRAEILAAAVDEVFAPFENLILEMSSETKIWASLTKVFVSTLPVNEENKQLANLIAQVISQVPREPAVALKWHEKYGSFRLKIRELLEAGQKNGELSSDFDVADQADILAALFDGLALHALCEPERFAPERLTRLMTAQLQKLAADSSFLLAPAGASEKVKPKRRSGGAVKRSRQPV